MCTHNASVPAFMWPVIYFTSYFYDNLLNMHNKMPATRPFMAPGNFAKISYVRWQQLADQILCATCLLWGGPCLSILNY